MIYRDVNYLKAYWHFVTCEVNILFHKIFEFLLCKTIYNVVSIAHIYC